MFLKGVEASAGFRPILTGSPALVTAGASESLNSGIVQNVFPSVYNCIVSHPGFLNHAGY